ncbi:hypothetical protein [Oryza sativa Japonica Group]|uniref:Uncharacterized protein n=1 Tax=Oryza sativa subsp. japonica TaxID=39947 RepID=Q9LJ15_ORYSJ|nr:hypothetical protein [Oryza sativa Japonica Group]
MEGLETTQSKYQSLRTPVWSAGQGGGVRPGAALDRAGAATARRAGGIGRGRQRRLALPSTRSGGGGGATAVAGRAGATAAGLGRRARRPSEFVFCF